MMYFFLGLCYVGRYFGAYVNITEYASSQYKSALSTLLLAFDCIMIILITMYFKTVPRGDHVYLEIGGLVLIIVAFLCTLWLPESPEYLYSMFRFRECRQVLEFIAKVNGKMVKEFTYFNFDVEDD